MCAALIAAAVTAATPAAALATVPTVTLEHDGTATALLTFGDWCELAENVEPAAQSPRASATP
jgi:hypothetical protein